MKKRNWLRLLLWSHVIGVIAFYWILWLRTVPEKEDRSKKLPPEPQDRAQPVHDLAVSIIVPARNEERNIRRCVTSLLEQNYERYEVIVVDDGSTDTTPCILDEIAQTHPRGNRLWVLRLRDLPAGWAGKPHALHAGVQESHGEWLLFTDADTWHAPGALPTALSQAVRERIDLLSLGTEQELPGFWEKVVMPMAYIGISLQYPVKKINDPNSSIALANGQYILIRRAVYDVLGGYARPEMRGTLLDDRDLAQLVKRSGFRLRLVDGRDLVHVHMYQGLRDIWRGWRKNAYLGSRGGIAFTFLQLVGLPMVSIAPFLLPLLLWVGRVKSRGSVGAGVVADVVRGCLHRPGEGRGIHSSSGHTTPRAVQAPPHHSSPLPPLLGKNPSRVRTAKVTPIEVGAATLLELGPLLAYRRWVDRELGIPWYYAFTHPIAGALFEGILAQSAWRVVTRKGVDWRGRQYYNERAARTWSQYLSKSRDRTV